MPAYNLFRRKEHAEVYCAVPEDCVVPPFVTGELWEFGGKLVGGKLEGQRDAPVGFNQQAAMTSVRFNGFYLFQAFTM
jgi:hypothetical protein